MKLLTVIACHNADCIRAERLIDQIFALNRKEQKGYALILFAPSTPQENRDKIRISAEVTFKSVAIINASIPKEIENQATVGNTNAPIVANLMFQAAKHIAENCRMAWLWLEPDSLPLKSDWMEKIEETYVSQPMRYMAGHLKRLDKDKNEIFSISRMGVYPNDSIGDFEASTRLNSAIEFFVFHKSSKCRLFQNTVIESVNDFEKLRPDAVLAHGDKRAVLVDKVVEQQKEIAVEKERHDCPPVRDLSAANREPRSFVSTREIKTPKSPKVAVTC